MAHRIHSVRSRVSKRVKDRRNANCTVSVGPLRCLAMISLALPQRRIARIVILGTIEEHDHVGVLLDGARLAQVAQLGFVVLGAAGLRARLNCESAISGTSNSLAMAFRPREMAETSWLRFS